MKPIQLFLICMLFLSLACTLSAQLPTVAPTAKAAHVTAVAPTDAPVKVLVTPFHTYITTAPLHIRSCAGIDCDVLAYLAAGVSVDVIAAGISGPGCAGAEWYAIEAGGVAGFVCSLYVEVR